MEIKHEHNGTKGKFVAYLEDEKVGEMTYSQAGDDKIIIDHTEASSDHAGKGIGKNLVLAGVDYARNNGVKIIPLCPFAKRTLEKDDSFLDVLVK